MDIDPKYLADWSGLTRGTPREVHRPRTTEEVARVVQAARERATPITVQGGMTGLAGGAVPADGDIVINLERMDAIEEIDELEGVMVVQAGATLEQVQQAAQAAGWLFPVDLGARGTCQVGGNAATNAGGERVLRYGTMRDAVLGVEVVLPDGSVLDSMTRLVKNSSGPDLRFLFIGAEGTLGIITRLVLKLVPPTGPAVTAFVAVPELAAVATLLRELKRSLGGRLQAYEFLSREFMATAASCGAKCPLSMNAPWYVLVEAAGAFGEQSEEAIEAALGAALEQGLASDCAIAASLSDQADFWRVRQCIPELLSHLKPTVNFDVALPWAETTAYIGRVQEKLDAACPQATHLFFGHLGDNNIHLMTGPHGPEAQKEVERIVYAELAGCHASLSAEHGIGFIKKPFLGTTRHASQLVLMKRIKATLDPQNLMNPGRIFD